MQSAFYQRHASELSLGAALRMLTQPVLTWQGLIAGGQGLGWARGWQAIDT